MPEEKKPTKRNQLALRNDKDILRAVAMDIGKQVAFHIESMYPDAVKAASSTFLLSVRNCTHNEIVAAVESTTEYAIRIKANDYERKLIRKLRKIGNEAEAHRTGAER